jgi:hypothetical protein
VCSRGPTRIRPPRARVADQRGRRPDVERQAVLLADEGSGVAVELRALGAERAGLLDRCPQDASCGACQRREPLGLPRSGSRGAASAAARDHEQGGKEGQAGARVSVASCEGLRFAIDGEVQAAGHHLRDRFTVALVPGSMVFEECVERVHPIGPRIDQRAHPAVRPARMHLTRFHDVFGVEIEGRASSGPASARARCQPGVPRQDTWNFRRSTMRKPQRRGTQRSERRQGAVPTS